jgi:hypothetical protein
MSDAQAVLAFVFGDQPAALDDKKAALALAKECDPVVSRIAKTMGKIHGADGKWARAGRDHLARPKSRASQPISSQGRGR